MFFFFKQKTAYEMRISDWSSDVCSSDLMAVALFLLTIAVYVAIWPSAGPRGGTGDRAEFVAASLGVIPVLVIFLLVIGGMYAGFYNPTPAAAVGAFLVWGYGALRRGMRWAALRDSLLETAKTSGMI